MKLNNINKILFITLSNIGDVILTLPALSVLKNSFPDAKIDIIVGPRPKEIFAKDPRVNRVFTYDKHVGLKEKVDFINKLRKEKYDIAVDMRTGLTPVLVWAKYRTSLFSLKKNKFKHKKMEHLSKLPLTLTLSPEGRGEMCGNIYVDQEDRERVSKLLEEKGVAKDDILIGISHSCRSLLKQWDVQGFIKVADGLLREKHRKIVLIGDHGQLDRAAQIIRGARSEGIIDLTGKINLNELFALTEKLNVLLTCDSASLHIACDLGIKIVALFGPTDPEEYGPTGENDIVISKNIKCVPCRKAVCRFNHECMEQIGAEEVMEAVRKILIG